MLDSSDFDDPPQSLHQMQQTSKVDCEDLVDEFVLGENYNSKWGSKPQTGFSQTNLGKTNEQRRKEESDREELKKGNRPPDDFYFDEFDY